MNKSYTKSLVWAGALVLVALSTAIAALAHARFTRERLAERLLAVPADRAALDPALVRFAFGEARPLVARYCETCHGADLKGSVALGAPDLLDSVWLYGDGSVYEIERTILFGVRSADSRSHNVTDMPAFGARGMLSAQQVSDVVEYLLKLNGRSYQAEAAEEGRTVFYGKGDCFDCHGPDAKGDSDYGAPDLTVNTWNSGGDPQALYRSIYYGRHRVMPAWFGTLTLEQIRALAVYIHVLSHPAHGEGAAAGAG